MDGIMIVLGVLGVLVPFEIFQLQKLFQHSEKISRIEQKICDD